MAERRSAGLEQRDRARLERIAYGRAVDEAAREFAQRTLSELEVAAAAERAALAEAARVAREEVERGERLAQWHPELETRLLSWALRGRDSRRWMSLLASLVVLAFVASAAWAYGAQLRGSLAVFDRPMSLRDESAPGWVYGTVLPLNDTVAVRWIGNDARYNLYGVLGRDGDVCLAIVQPGVGGSTSCATAEQFADGGVRIEGDIAGRPYAVEWGPRGPPRWDAVPVT